MTINIKQIDAFTAVPFGGNPAGVVTEADHLDDDTMQKIAREMNVSETAFVLKSAVADFKVRFFTPNMEVDLCGHATIATFSALYDEGRLDPSRTAFFQETKAGVLNVEVMQTNGRPFFLMTQAVPKFEDVRIKRADIARALGLDEKDLLDVPPQKVSTGIWWFVVGVKSLDRVAGARPDLAYMKELSERHGFIGMIPFCLQAYDPKCNYHMRAFAPLAAIDEDPVCGTGSGSTASYIAAHGLIGFENEINLVSEMGVAVKRPGMVHVRICKENGGIAAVKVGGTAFTVLEGKMRF